MLSSSSATFANTPISSSINPHPLTDDPFSNLQHFHLDTLFRPLSLDLFNSNCFYLAIALTSTLPSLIPTLPSLQGSTLCSLRTNLRLIIYLISLLCKLYSFPISDILVPVIFLLPRVRLGSLSLFTILIHPAYPDSSTYSTLFHVPSSPHQDPSIIFILQLYPSPSTSPPSSIC